MKQIKKLIVSSLPKVLKDQYNRSYDKKLEVEFEVLFNSGTTDLGGIITDVTLLLVNRVADDMRNEMEKGIRNKLKKFIK